MNILTFDIEDWFHTHENRQHFSGHTWKKLPSRVENNTMRILNLLEEFDIKATFFILGWVAEHHPDLVKKIYSKGHEIGSHSHWHHHANKLAHEDFEKDLVRSISVLSNIIGDEITAYRAPGFSLREKDYWAFEILAANGILKDSSIQIYPFKHDKPFVINTKSGSIMEYPLIKSRFGFPYTGGGYFRALPDSMFKKLFEKPEKNMQSSTYHLLYFHPRDFDSEYFDSNLFTLYRNILNAYNTDVCMQRLRIVLAANKTLSLAEALDIKISNK